MYGHVITKFSWIGSLPHFLTHGATLRSLRARELRYYAIYMLDNIRLKDVTSFKDLGFTISKDLSRHNHVNLDVNKDSNLLGLIKLSVGTTNVNAFLHALFISGPTNS